MMVLSARLANELGGWEHVVALRDLFLRGLPDARRRLEAALAAGELEGARRVAHALRADLATFELVEPARLAREVETSCREGQLACAREAWTRLAPLLASLDQDLGEARPAVAEPARSALPATGEPARSPLTSTRPRRVLVVDDTDLVRRVLRHQLEARGHQVAEARAGKAGLALLAEEAFDVALIDLSLPDMSGLELLRAVPPDRRPTRLIALTGSPSYEAACLEAGADRFLVKPVPLAALWDAVEEADGAR